MRHLLLGALKTTLEGKSDAGGEVSPVYRPERVALGSDLTYAALGAVAGLMLVQLIGLGAFAVPLVVAGFVAGVVVRMALGRIQAQSVREERQAAVRNVLDEKETEVQRQLARTRTSGSVIDWEA